MTLATTGPSNGQDRWWPVGPVLALIILTTIGTLELLFLSLNIAGLTWVAVNGFPSGWCPDAIECPSDVNLLVALPQFLIPLAILGVGALLCGLSFRGPKTVSRRPLRWGLSAIAFACPVLVYVWIFG